MKIRNFIVELKRDRVEIRIGERKFQWTIEPRFWRNPILGGLFLSLLPIICHLFSPAFLPVITNANIYSSIGISMILITLGAGRLNFGPQLFIGLGGYITALLTSRYSVIYAGLSPLQTLPIIIIICGLVGIAEGVIALFRRGIYYALLTLLPPLIFLEVTYIWADIFKGEVGLAAIPPIIDTGSSRINMLAYSYLSLAMVLIFLFIGHRIMDSRLGIQMAAITDDDEAAQIFGVNLKFAKLLISAIGGALMGVCGWFNAHYFGTFAGITYLTFFYMMKVWLIFFVGGRAIFAGIIGGYFVGFLDSVLMRLTAAYRMELLQPALYLCILLVIMNVLGYDGLWGMYRKRRYREYRARLKLR